MLRPFGTNNRHLAADFGCKCCSPRTQRLFARIDQGLSRRSVLKGIAGSLAAPAFGLIGTASAQGPKPPIRLKNVRIFDGVGGTLIEGKDVIVQGRFIHSLIHAAEPFADADTIDCGGGTLMPGMIDAHWHCMLAAIPEITALTADIAYLHLVAAQEAQRTLLRGFTTVRDVGGPSFALKRAIDEDRFIGPRIYPSGAMISQTSGHGDFRVPAELPRTPQSNLSIAEKAGISMIADGEAEVLRRVREQLLLGASQIKIMGGGGVASAHDPIDTVQYSKAEIKAAVSAAADWGTYVCVHTYTSAGILRALDCGVKSIEHGQLADEETVKRMADADAWWSIQPFLADEDANIYASPEQREEQMRIAAGTARAVEWGLKYKVQMALGTDILFNPKGTSSQGRQLAKFARWLDNADVLRFLTSGNADLTALSGPRNPYPGTLGRIQPGAYADILVLNGNPLEDISLIGDPDRSMRLIMKDGLVHKNTLASDEGLKR